MRMRISETHVTYATLGAGAMPILSRRILEWMNCSRRIVHVWSAKCVPLSKDDLLIVAKNKQ